MKKIKINQNEHVNDSSSLYFVIFVVDFFINLFYECNIIKSLNTFKTFYKHLSNPSFLTTSQVN